MRAFIKPMATRAHDDGLDALETLHDKRGAAFAYVRRQNRDKILIHAGNTGTPSGCVVAGQSRRGSAVETLAGVAIGYVVALVSQLLIFPLFDIHVPLSDNLLIGAWFTAVSIARGYCVRRLFNRFLR